MKRLISILTGFTCFLTIVNAQVNNVAVLQHNGTITAYYTSSAFEQAYADADDGDTIMLSGGSFTFEVEEGFAKGITVRGAGYIEDDSYYSATKIINPMYFYSPDADMTANFEGINFVDEIHLNNYYVNDQGKINFIKCYFNATVYFVSDQSSYSIEGIKSNFINCSIGILYFYEYSYPNATFANCYIREGISSSLSSATMTTFVNCNISFYENAPSFAFYMNFINCIIGHYGTNIPLPYTSNAMYCISYSIYDMFSECQSVNCVSSADGSEEYTGNDGTPVGTEGGMAPYTWKVSYPVITTLKAGKTDKDGKLNITIGVDEITEDDEEE